MTRSNSNNSFEINKIVSNRRQELAEEASRLVVLANIQTQRDADRAEEAREEGHRIYEQTRLLAQPIVSLAVSASEFLINQKVDTNISVITNVEKQSSIFGFRREIKETKQKMWTLSYEEYSELQGDGNSGRGVYSITIIKGISLSREGKLFNMSGNPGYIYGEEFDPLALLGGPDRHSVPSVRKTESAHTEIPTPNITEWQTFLADAIIRLQK